MHHPLKRDTWWKRIRYKYRLTLENEDTMQVYWHFRISKLRAAMLGMLVFLVSLALCSALILFTPLRTYLPGGMNDDERQFLLDESMRLDSLQQQVDRQTRYLESLRIAISGQASTPGGAFEIAYLLGKDETLRRLKGAIDRF